MKPITTLVLVATLAQLAASQDRVRVEDAKPPRKAEAAPVKPQDDMQHQVVYSPAALPNPGEPMLGLDRGWDGEAVPERLRGSPDRLSFASGDWRPPDAERIDPAFALAARTMPPGDPLYGFVILTGHDTQDRMAALRRAGAEPIEFHPCNAYKVRLAAGSERVVLDLPFVRWLGPARAWQKVSPELSRALERPAHDKPLRLYVTVFESDFSALSERIFVGPEPALPADPRLREERPWRTRTNGRAEQALLATGADVVSYYKDSKSFLVEATREQAQKLVDLNCVHYAEIATPIVFDHDESMPMVCTDMVRLDYPGKGDVIAGFIDSGLDSRHRDLFVNLVGMSWVTDGLGSFRDALGHGTHVGGTILGHGVVEAGLKGSAPGLGYDATHPFVVARIIDGSDHIVGANQAAKEATAIAAFDYLQSRGAMVVNCSWHTLTNGLGTDAVSVDADAKAYRDGMLFVIAAGNRGSTDTTINSPAAAKNVLAIASVYDHDSTFLGTSPAGIVATSSSRGYADDGRWKPNCAAPGNEILSLKAGTTDEYVAKTGTSMAAPHVAGIAATVMEHYTAMQGRPHLLGAKLMATATYRAGAASDTLVDYGFGKVNAYRAHWSSNAAGGWTSGYGWATLTPGVSATFDTLVVPDDCERVRVLTWCVESAASTGAGNAVKNNVDLYLDVPPYTAATNTGEYSSTNVLNNVETITISGAAATALRSQVLRIKFHPTSIRAGDGVKVGCQYVFFRGSPNPTGTATCTASDYYIKPNATIDIRTRFAVDSYFGLNTIANAGGFAPFTGLSVDHVLKDGVVATRNAPVPQWLTIGDVLYSSPRELVWHVRAPNYDTTKIFGCWMYSSNVNGGGAVTDTSPTVCVDGTAPDAPGNLRSAMHPYDQWSNASPFVADWDHALDHGPSGRAGYSYVIAGNVAGTPDLVTETAAATYSTPVVSSLNPYFFSVRTVDRSGNGSATVSHKFWVDTTVPSFTAFTIDAGGLYTRSRLVDLQLVATDTFSGVSEMRFSNDGVTYGPWIAFAANVVNWDLGNAFGGSLTQGRRMVWAQVRDQAKNQPATRTASITYDSTRPVGTITLAAGTAYTGSPLVDVTLDFDGTFSPLESMRFSNDGAAWSAWEAYAPLKANWDLRLFGGNANYGGKTVRCEVRDLAQNSSLVATDDITFTTAPTLVALVPNATATLRHPEEPIALSGANHDFLIEAVLRKGSIVHRVPLGTPWSLAGHLLDLAASNASTLYLPKPIEPGTWTVALRNALGESNALNLTLAAPADPGVLDAPDVHVMGAAPLVLVSADANTFDASSVFVSASNAPSVLPGWISMDIGNGFTNLLQLPGTYKYDAVRAAWTLTLPLNDPALSGFTFYLESVQVDSRAPLTLPLRTTNAIAVRLQ